jgi:hypothetical protein
MGLLDALGSLTMAAGEELPGITQRAAATSVKRINAAIGADFEAARVAGDVPLMTEVMNKAKTGGYNRGGEAPSTEVFGVMSQGIIGFENDDEEKEKKRVDQLIALGGPAGMQAQVDRYKSLNPNALPNEIKSYEDHLKLEAKHKRALSESAVTTAKAQAEKAEKGPSEWAMSGKFMYNKKTGEFKPVAGAGVDDEAWTKQYNTVSAGVRDGKMTPDQGINLMQTALRREFDPDEMAGLKNSLNQFKLAPLKQLKTEDDKKITMGDTLQTIADRAISKLEDPVVKAALGKIRGSYTLFRGWADGKDDMAPEVQEFLQMLDLSTDFISRKMSGAALTEDERTFYKELLGRPTQEPKAIRRQLIGVIQSLEEEQKAIYENAWQKAGYSRKSDEMRNSLRELSYQSPHIDLIAEVYGGEGSVFQGGGDGEEDEDVGQTALESGFSQQEIDQAKTEGYEWDSNTRQFVKGS